MTARVLDGDERDEALDSVLAVVDPMLAEHGPEFVVGFLTSYVASRGMAADLADLARYGSTGGA